MRHRVFSCLGGDVTPHIDVSRTVPLRDGDLIALCTDGAWAPLGEALASELGRAPVNTTVPHLLDAAERAAGPTADNLSLIAMRWQAAVAVAEPSSAPSFCDTFIGESPVTDMEIERAIAEKTWEGSRLLATTRVDFFVDGEGEIVFRDLVLALEAGGFDARQLRSGALAIPGVHYRHENRGYTNGPARRIANIDTVLPSPYLSGILDKFFDKNLTPLLQTSRGCPYSCTFCASEKIWKRRVRFRSPSNIVDEIIEVIRNFL